MGYLDNIQLVHDIPQRAILSGQATQLLKQKGKKKKIRRGKGSVKKQKKLDENKKLMLTHYKQRKQMYRDFQRLINT